MWWVGGWLDQVGIKLSQLSTKLKLQLKLKLSLAISPLGKCELSPWPGKSMHINLENRKVYILFQDRILLKYYIKSFLNISLKCLQKNIYFDRTLLLNLNMLLNLNIFARRDGKGCKRLIQDFSCTCSKQKIGGKVCKEMNKIAPKKHQHTVIFILKIILCFFRSSSFFSLYSFSEAICSWSPLDS